MRQCRAYTDTDTWASEDVFYLLSSDDGNRTRISRSAVQLNTSTPRMRNENNRKNILCFMTENVHNTENE